MSERGAGLSGEMIADLADFTKYPNFLDDINQARAGQAEAIRKLIEFTLQLDRNSFSDTWSGRVSVEDLRKAFHTEIRLLKSHQSTPQKTMKITLSPKGIETSRPGNQTTYSSSPPLPPWNELADKAGFPKRVLTKSDKEILSMINRVLINGKGWGPNDSMRGKWEWVVLQPSKLAYHGQKMSTRTYQRSIKHLLDLGLIVHVGNGNDGTRKFIPAWWPTDSIESSISEWERAAVHALSINGLSHQSRPDAGPLAQECRTTVVPTVQAESGATNKFPNRLFQFPVRHSTGRLTYYSYILTFKRPHFSKTSNFTRPAPCLPDRQAQSASFFPESPGMEDWCSWVSPSRCPSPM